MRKLAKSDLFRYVCLRVRQHGTSRFLLGGFSRNFVFDDFLLFFQGNLRIY